MFDLQQLTCFAIHEKYPGAEFSVHEKYETLTWMTDKYSKPTKEEFDTLVKNRKLAEPMRLLREERDRKLAETDWKDLPSYPGTDQEEWRTYRQSLRDLPSVAEPQLDENGQLTNVTWPTKPT